MRDKRAEDPLHERLAAEEKIVHTRSGEPEYDNCRKRRFE